MTTVVERAAVDPLHAEFYGVEWLREICLKSGKGNLPKNIDARGVLRTVDELIAEVGRLRSAREWRPIGEAPKDGTWIMVFTLGCLRPAIVQWNNGRWEDDDMQQNPEQLAMYTPTHFMLLPTPPTPGAKT